MPKPVRRMVQAAASWLLLTTFAPAELARPPASPEQALLWAQPVALDADRPGRTRLGELLFLEGWSLTSDEPRFGGISAIHVDGQEVIALSDAGYLFRHRLPRPDRPMPLEVRQLIDGTGSHRSKKNRDSEAMVVAGESIWISFERSNAIWRYDRRSLKGEAHARPRAMQDWPKNRGGEAMARLPDGRFLVIGERGRPDGAADAFLFDGDPARAASPPHMFRIERLDDHLITDAAALPDGRLLVLQRRASLLSGVSALLTIVETPLPAAPDLVRVRAIARFRPPVTTDNMEGLSVTHEGGRTILWIASDDNYMGIQQTLLLKFELRPRSR